MCLVLRYTHLCGCEIRRKYVTKCRHIGKKDHKDEIDQTEMLPFKCEKCNAKEVEKMKLQGRKYCRGKVAPGSLQ